MANLLGNGYNVEKPRKRGSDDSPDYMDLETLLKNVGELQRKNRFSKFLGHLTTGIAPRNK